MEKTGFKIILSADRLLMADYDTLLDGMMAAGLTTRITPDLAMRRFVSRPLAADGVRTRKAPLGLRVIEAALLERGHAPEDVAIVPPDRLVRAVGSATRAVLVSSGDPLGLGMNNSTMVGVAGGSPYTPIWYAELMRELRHLKAQWPALRVLAGGAGAWQFAQQPGALEALGIDAAMEGYGESEAVDLVERVLDGTFEGVLTRLSPAKMRADVPDLRGASSMGVVEVSRGCGLGCSFCTVRSHPMVHFPIEQIVRNVETNVRGGATSVALISEDIFRYGANGATPDPARVLELAEAVRGVAGLRIIQLDHANAASISRFPREALTELFQTLTRGVLHRLLWLNVGVETASGRLLLPHASAGKLGGRDPEEWEALCQDALRRLIEAGFTPMVSLLYGIPGERREDVLRTLEFVRRFERERILFFPLFHAPVQPGLAAFTSADMTPLHWELFRLCYRISFRWLAALIWDNHTGSGVGLGRRLAVQAGGWLQTQRWNRWMRLRSREAEARHGG